MKIKNFVCDKICEENLKKIETYIEKIVELAATCNLKRDDIFEMINMIMEDE